MPKVLIAHVPYDTPGGEDRHVSDLMLSYKELGFEVVRLPGTAEKGLSTAVNGLLWGRENEWKTALQGVDFVHSHNLHPSLGPAFLRWLTEQKIPVMQTIHNHRFYCTNGLAMRNGSICKDCRGNYPWRALAHNCNDSWAKTLYHAAALTEAQQQNLFLSSTKLFLAPSPYVRDELIRSGFPADRIRLLMHPVKSPASIPAAPEFDFIYAGRLSAEKGVRNLLKCAELLPKRSFVISGNGPLETEVRAATERFSNLSFYSNQSHLEALSLIAKSRVGCIASTCNETFSLFAFECFLAGKKAVVPDLESTRWLSEEPFFGILADTRSIDSLIKSLESALEQAPPSSAIVSQLQQKMSPTRFRNELLSLTMELRNKV